MHTSDIGMKSSSLTAQRKAPKIHNLKQLC